MTGFPKWISSATAGLRSDKNAVSHGAASGMSIEEEKSQISDELLWNATRLANLESERMYIATRRNVLIVRLGELNNRVRKH